VSSHRMQAEQANEAISAGWPLSGLAETGAKNLKTMIDIQADFFSTAADLNKEWLGRLKSQAELTSDFIAELAEARSIPDVVQSCEDCFGHQMELFTVDARRLLDVGRKAMDRLVHDGSGFTANS
jgi:phasin protein